jgi:predicted MPP superfamily phosphohydrolase
MKSVWTWLSVLLLAGIIAYGMMERDWIEVTHHEIGAVQRRTPVRLIQLSDLHLRKADQRAIAVANLVRERHPDVVVLTGDIIDRAENFAGLEAFLQSLGGEPKIAILGNWEYWSEMDLKALKLLYARHQTELLVNDCAQLELQGRAINFVGLDDVTASHANLPRAIRSCPNEAEAILLEHSPGFFGKPLDVVPETAQFMLGLSGHTHGGQLAIFGSPIMLPPGSGQYNSGLYATKYGPLYVSRGIGTSELPLRIGARPEIVEFELK